MPTLSLFGGNDEFVPQSVSTDELREKFAAVLTHSLSQTRVLEGAGHSLDGHEQEAVDVMIEFVKSVSSQ